MKLFLTALLLVLLAAACQPGPEEATLPTLAQLPTSTLTDTPAPTDTPIPPTDTPLPTDTPAPTDTSTPTATRTPTDTATPGPSPTVDLTRAAVATQTAAVVEAPRYSTLTPVPTNQTAPPQPTGTPQVMADVVITESQFQEQVDLAIQQFPNVQSAAVDFRPDEIAINLTATGADGTVENAELVIHVNTASGMAQFQGGLTPNPDVTLSDAFVQFATNDFFLAMVGVLDTILHQRLGPEQDLQTLRITDTDIEVGLLVNAPGS